MVTKKSFRVSEPAFDVWRNLGGSKTLKLLSSLRACDKSSNLSRPKLITIVFSSSGIYNNFKEAIGDRSAGKIISGVLEWIGN